MSATEIFEWKEPPGAGSTVRSLNSGKLYKREDYGSSWYEVGAAHFFYTWENLLQKERSLVVVKDYQRFDKVDETSLADLPVGSVVVPRDSDSFGSHYTERLVKIGTGAWIAMIGSDVESVPESYMTQDYMVVWVPENA